MKLLCVIYQALLIIYKNKDLQIYHMYLLRLRRPF